MLWKSSPCLCTWTRIVGPSQLYGGFILDEIKHFTISSVMRFQHVQCVSLHYAVLFISRVPSSRAYKLL
jgi:hypothetical protein